MKNNKARQNQPGYILVFSLMFIALVVMLATRISNRGLLHVSYAKIMIDREHAKMLALSGLQIAMAQLSTLEEEKKNAEEKNKKDAKKTPSKSALWTEKEAKEFIKNVWPLMYKWQEFKLTRDKYGTDGVVKICIGAEGGKININQTFDFDKRKFIGEGQKKDNYQEFYKNIFKKINTFVKGEKRFEAFENYLKKKQQFEKILKSRQNRLYDPTEFLKLDGFVGFGNKVFYKPQETIMEKGKVVKTKATVYWTDIFTIWSGSKKISPWLVSPSIKRLLKFKGQDLKKKAESIAKKFKANLAFPADWDKVFEPVFGVKYKNLPDWLKFVFDTKFEPKTFSVLSYGKVGDVSQKIFAIIERKKVKRKKKTVVEFE
ncbi:hypothetical protein ACFLYU_05745, partial [Candidatus Dependentiae bacterium]